MMEFEADVKLDLRIKCQFDNINVERSKLTSEYVEGLIASAIDAAFDDTYQPHLYIQKITVTGVERLEEI